MPIHIDRIELYDAKQDNIDAQKVYRALSMSLCNLKATERKYGKVYCTLDIKSSSTHLFLLISLLLQACGLYYKVEDEQT